MKRIFIVVLSVFIFVLINVNSNYSRAVIIQDYVNENEEDIYILRTENFNSLNYLEFIKSSNLIVLEVGYEDYIFKVNGVDNINKYKSFISSVKKTVSFEESLYIENIGVNINYLKVIGMYKDIIEFKNKVSFSYKKDRYE